jgi:hypothetical protein
MSTNRVDWIAQDTGDINKPNFGGMNRYPSTLVVGDTLFPLIYIFFVGNVSRSKRIYNQDIYETGLDEYLRISDGIRPGNSSNFEDTKQSFITQAKRFSAMLDGALEKNADYVWALREKVNGLLATYRSRIPHMDIKVSGNKYYMDPDKKVASRTPVMLDMPSFDTAEAALETLRILLENNIISPSYNLGIRPINLYDGKFAEEDPEWQKTSRMMREIGIPRSGVFSVNNVPKSSWMYHTFTGIDLTSLASVGDVVSELEGLSTFTWSIHRGKQTQRVLGKSAPSGRTRGNRTIAGTMIFAISDHHPLLKILPYDYPAPQSLSIVKDPNIWRPLVMSDDIPPFDLVLIAQNEYGFASTVVLYGVEITDEGVTVGIDNLITEMVLQYTAVAMDPIQEIPPNESGVVDPFGLMSVKSSNLYRRRESIIAGAGGDILLEEQYNAHNDMVFRAIHNNDLEKAKRAMWNTNKKVTPV